MLLNSFFCFTSSWFVQFLKCYAVDLHLHLLFSLYMLSKYHLPNLLVRLAFQKKKLLVGLKIRPMLQFDSSNFYNKREFFQKVVGLSWELFFFFFCEKLY